MSYRRGLEFDTKTKFTVKAIRFGRTERPLMFIINVEEYQFIVHCLIPYDTSFFCNFLCPSKLEQDEIRWIDFKIIFSSDANPKQGICEYLIFKT